MRSDSIILSRQEKRILNQHGIPKVTFKRPRTASMLENIRNQVPRIAVQRAALMVESFKSTESLPIVLRWAKALEHVLNNIDIHIGPFELIVGRCGPPGRYGVLYPELKGSWLEKGLHSLPTRKEGRFGFEEDDEEIIRDKIVPYFKGRTLFEAQFELLPPDTRRIAYKKDDPYGNRNIVIDSTANRTSLQWVPDYEKVLNVGLHGIRQTAANKIGLMSDPFDGNVNFSKYAFYKSVLIVCDAVDNFAKRYAELARSEAKKTKKKERVEELLRIAEICDWVPGNPARNFGEAIQAQWFTQVVFRIEQLNSVGNGRIDQYLYPYYKRDILEERITQDRVMELFENLWLNMAQAVRFRQSGDIQNYEGLPHFEHTTIGGQTKDGEDATNELSYLLIQSKRDFPLDYPDLGVRIHSRTPEKFLFKICELIKEGTGFPKLLNDEQIIPTLLSKGANIEEARDYCGSGCTEARMINRDVYMTGICLVNLGACVEMALYNGKMLSQKDEVLGVETGDATNFKQFSDVMNAVKQQVRNLAKHVFIINQVADSVRPHILASPFQSCLHELCMKSGADIHSGKIDGGIALGAWDIIGFGTAIDSLAAIKKLVYDDKAITMKRLLEALRYNFEGMESIRQLCLNAPKYGNCDPYADSIGKELEDYFRYLSSKYRTIHGGILDARYVPVTSHIPFGRVTGATPNGRKRGEALSEGISPSQGCDVKGPTSTLMSIANTNASAHKEIAARLLNVKLSPQAVDGESGTKSLASLIRTWCDLKLWHIQFNVINSDTLRNAQKDPEKYRNLLVRVAGYSAYFVDLSKELQNEIIARTEHRRI